MIDHMPDRIKKLALPLVMVMCLGSGALAQDEEHKADGRLWGYIDGENTKVIELKPAGSAGTWFILAGLGLLGLGVMFKSGKRTHLD